MLENIKCYFRPTRIEQAIEILQKGKGKYVPLAGGTSVLINKNEKIQGFVSLRDLNLNFIKKEKNSIKIGAMTRISDILENRITASFAKSILFKACEKIGSTLNRNLITIGGNIVQLYRWSDLPAALLVLDTKLKIKGHKTKTISAEKFFEKHPKSLLKYNELLTEIEIKIPTRSFGTDFIKFAQTEVDHTILDVAVYIETEKNKCRDIRIAYAGLKPLPFRAYNIEKMMKNRNIEKSLIEDISEKAAEILQSPGDLRATRDYKKHLVKVLTIDAIENAIKI